MAVAEVIGLTMRPSNSRDVSTLDYWFAVDRLPDDDPRFGIEAILTDHENRPADLIGNVNLVELSGYPIGLIRICPDWMRNTPIESAHLYLAPEYRKRGLGKEMLSTIITLAIKMGLPEIFAVTNVLNLPMRKALEHPGSRWQLVKKIRQRVYYRVNLVTLR